MLLSGVKLSSLLHRGHRLVLSRLELRLVVEALLATRSLRLTFLAGWRLGFAGLPRGTLLVASVAALRLFDFTLHHLNAHCALL